MTEILCHFVFPMIVIAALSYRILVLEEKIEKPTDINDVYQRARNIDVLVGYMKELMKEDDRVRGGIAPLLLRQRYNIGCGEAASLIIGYIEELRKAEKNESKESRQEPARVS